MLEGKHCIACVCVCVCVCVCFLISVLPKETRSSLCLGLGFLASLRSGLQCSAWWLAGYTFVIQFRVLKAFLSLPVAAWAPQTLPGSSDDSLPLM